MKKIYQFLGSLTMAVIVIVTLAITLALGTWVEAQYGTPAAQHFFYRAVWFQILLFLLSATLVISALHRLPWKKHHVGFVVTHLGIILILLGNVLGIWGSVDGHLILSEGETQNDLSLPRDLLWVQPANPGTPFTFPLALSEKPWAHNIHESFSTPSAKPIHLLIDQYLPNASVTEKVIVGGEEFPAAHLELNEPGQVPEDVWLFSRDPERFGFRWGEAHVLFFELPGEKELSLLEHPKGAAAHDKGKLRLEFPQLKKVLEVPVDASLGKTIALEGTPYTLTLKDYFADFIITDEGPKSRTDEPINPAVSFLLKGPEGEDAFLAFALHPEFEERHGFTRAISVKAVYETEAALPSLPPALVAVVRTPEAWHLLMSSPDGKERKIIPLSLHEEVSHPWLALSFKVLETLPRAEIVQEFHLLDNDVKQQAVHVVVERGGIRQEAWIPHGGVAHLTVGDEKVVLAYQPAKERLPFSVTLLDFRKKEYPGTSVPSSFESDVDIADSEARLRLTKTISMNHPFTYRGYTMFQSSFIEGPVETTVLSVRKDPGTPLVYTGFVTVIIGLLLMFYTRNDSPKEKRKKHVL